MHKFTIKDAGGKGQGWFATCDIPAMAEILNEKCLFCVPRDADSAAVHARVAALPPDALDAFKSLHGNDIFDKFWSNCSPFPNADDPFGLKPSKELGLYLQCAKLNHACRPNAVRAMEGDIMSVVAQKNIKKDDEITVSYMLDNFQTAENRVREIRDKSPGLGLSWVQGCMCELCMGPEEELRASDQRRRQLAALRRILVEGGDNSNSGMVAMEMLVLMEKEGLSHGDMGMDASMALITAMASKSDFPATQKDKHMKSTTQTRERGRERERHTTESLSDMMHTAYARYCGVGEQVTVQNLVRKPEFNGRSATVVVAYNAVTGRVGVKMDDDDDVSLMAIHVKNLFLLD
jgi:hypothetical protein